MSSHTKRATIYLDADLHKALKVKAAEASKSVSDLVNEAVRESMAEYNTEEAVSWLEASFQLMDEADADSRGKEWKREDLYDL